jgi:hypothetical protein
MQFDQPFEADGIQYNGLRGLTQDDWVLLGITEVQDPVRPDDQLFWVSDNADGSFTATPRSDEDLAAREKAKTAQAIVAVESAQPITQRALRELMIAIGAAMPAAQESLFYKRAVEQEAQVAALRVKLK